MLDDAHFVRRDRLIYTIRYVSTVYITLSIRMQYILHIRNQHKQRHHHRSATAGATWRYWGTYVPLHQRYSTSTVLYD